MGSAPVPAVPRAAAAVVLPALVGALEGARALAPLPVVAALVPVLLGRLRVLPGFALRAGAGLFPLVAVSAGALELLAAVLGLGVGRAVVVVPPRAPAVAARAAARAGAVRARQAPPVVVVPAGGVGAGAGLCPGAGPAGAPAAAAPLALLPQPIVRAL